MQTKIVRIKPEEADTKFYVLEEAADALRKGEVVAFPTETVYGLGANATDPKAVRKIFDLKGRPTDNPLIVHLHSKSDIEKFADISNEAERTIIETLMPGPITVVLRRKENITPLVSAGLETVGIRVPYHRIAQKLIELSGVPVCAPSANISGKPSATDPQTVVEEFGGKIPLIIDSGRTHIGIESTVVLVKEEKSKFTVLILRPGFITKEDIEGALGNTPLPKPFEVIYSEEFQKDTPLSPGQKYKHYSPMSEVVVLRNIEKIDGIATKLRAKKVGILGRASFIKEVKERLKLLGIEEVIEFEWCKHDLLDCARNLFLAYRTFDREKTSLIVVESLEEKGVGYSIMNRVKKSASYFV